MKNLLGKTVTAVSHGDGMVKLGFADGSRCVVWVRKPPPIGVNVKGGPNPVYPRLTYSIAETVFDHVLGGGGEED